MSHADKDALASVTVGGPNIRTSIRIIGTCLSLLCQSEAKRSGPAPLADCGRSILSSVVGRIEVASLRNFEPVAFGLGERLDCLPGTGIALRICCRHKGRGGHKRGDKSNHAGLLHLTSSPLAAAVTFRCRRIIPLRMRQINQREVLGPPDPAWLIDVEVAGNTAVRRTAP